MALLAEQLIEEWLHGQGYFTLRGLKLGVHEADLLGVRFVDGRPEGIHVEVSISTRPVGYITPLTVDDVKATGAGGVLSAKRRDDDAVLERAVAAWVHKKFAHPRKLEAMQQLAPGIPFRRVYVMGRYNYQAEVDLIASHGVEIRTLNEIVAELPAGRFKTSGIGADMATILAFV
jgi:hypothetical protein